MIMRFVINLLPIFVILIPILLIIGAIIYVILYNKNLNKVLETGKPNRMLDKNQYINLFAVIGTFILAIILIFQSIRHTKFFNEIEAKLEQLTTEISHLRSRVGFLESDLDKFIEDQKNIYNTNYDYISFDKDTKEVKVRISFNLREILKDSQVTIKAININNQAESYTVAATGTGSYVGDLNLPYNNNYEVIVIEENDSLIKTYEVFSIYLKNQSLNQYKADFLMTNLNDITFLVLYDENSFIDLELTKVELKITKDEKVIYNQDVLNILENNPENNQYELSINSLVTIESGLYKFDVTLYNELGKIDTFSRYIDIYGR